MIFFPINGFAILLHLSDAAGFEEKLRVYSWPLALGLQAACAVGLVLMLQDGGHVLGSRLQRLLDVKVGRLVKLRQVLLGRLRNGIRKVASKSVHNDTAL